MESVTEKTLAVIADILGNSWALDAVLADIDRRGVTQIVNLGDCAYGSLDPAGALDRLIARAIPTVSGNQDRIVHAPPPDVRGSADGASRRRAASSQIRDGAPPHTERDELHHPAPDLLHGGLA
jgi:predicted phosphodiesterase